MHRLLFNIGPLPVYSYGTLLAVAFLVGIWVAQSRAKKYSLRPELILDLSLYILVGAVLGSRLLHVATEWPKYQRAPLTIFQLWEGGLSFQGGLAGGLLLGWWFVRRHGLSFWKLGDVVIPSVALGHAIGRLGCYLNGCCYGKPTELPWGVTFPPDSFAAQQYGPAHRIHPVQLYEASANLAVFFLLLAFSRRSRRPGQTICLYGILSGLSRFGWEFLRGDNDSVLFSLTLYQLISLVLVGASLTAMVYVSRRPGR